MSLSAQEEQFIKAQQLAYYYGKDGFNSAAQQRAVLAAKLRLPQGPEFTLGGFVGKADIGLEGVPEDIYGAYLLALLPVNDWLFVAGCPLR